MKDLIVIGAGTAGMTAARKCAAADWDVAMVDERPYGGTCALRGCDPKKILRRAAEIVDAARLMRGKGVDEGSLSIDWAELMAHKRDWTERMPEQVESGLETMGVKTLHGRARFRDAQTLELEDGSHHQARRFLIATGAKPRPLDVPSAGLLLDSTGFLDLEALPRRILFAGGGYISFEFAHLAARAGAEVTIINRGDRVLKAFDPDLVDLLVERSRAVGIGIETGTELAEIQRSGEVFRVTTRRGETETQADYDLVVHGAGRVAAVDHLDLEAAGVAADAAGVAVRPDLRSTSCDHVWAAGDAAATEARPLTPVAAIEGKVAASNMLKERETVPDYTGIPSAVFTIPELVRVGLSEAEAREQVDNLRVAYSDTSGWFSNLRVGETCAAAKILIDEDSDRIVGAHLVGPEYAELANFFGLSLKVGLTTRDLKAVTSAYPTVGSDLGSLLG
ncbi:dihydrolipoyl dehydrogenase family protein [Roseivivax marinus]|uniref:dihydrolipoyl dehydrogenase family protein n=1 Tax=Roseivivax marinus TaxID=1379903 RepID=UPI00273EB368|nr:NAD(P)/FAD-dependent oxidoreductase [Roseivivax marinus]